MTRRVSGAILQSLQGGVVPTLGLEHIAVGRERELEALTQDLATIADGGSSFRVIMGRYGSGKTFLGQMLRERALQRSFVVMQAELSQNTRFTGSAGQGQMLYRALLAKTASRTRPGGSALPALLERWLSDIQMQVESEDGIGHLESAFRPAMQVRIHQTLGEIEGMVHGFDFSKVVLTYLDGHLADDEKLRDASIRWIRGEYGNTTEVRQALNFRAIVNDGNWYDHLKILAGFVRQIGYRGLLVFVDELDHLYNLSHKISRENNYKRLQHIYDDTTQGHASHLGVILGATDQVVEDPRRGMFSNQALRTRLQESSLVGAGLRDLAGPLIRLEPLGHDEVLTLLRNLQAIHGRHYKWTPSLDDTQRERFHAMLLSQPGAATHLTPREIVKEFLTVLNLLQQYPERSLDDILGGDDYRPAPLQRDDWLEPAGVNGGAPKDPYTDFTL